MSKDGMYDSKLDNSRSCYNSDITLFNYDDNGHSSKRSNGKLRKVYRSV